MKISPPIRRSLLLVLGIGLGFQPIWIIALVDHYYYLGEVTGFLLIGTIFPLAGIVAGSIPSKLLDGFISGVVVGLLSYTLHVLLFYSQSGRYPEVLLETLGIPAAIIVFGLLGAAIRLHINNFVRRRKENKEPLKDEGNIENS